mgnify:CR=1 FL=1
MATSGHVKEGTNITVLVPAVQPSAIVKADALLTIAIPVARDCKLDRIHKLVFICNICCDIEHLNEHSNI